MQILTLLLALLQMSLSQQKPETTKTFHTFIIGKISQFQKLDTLTAEQFETLDYKTPYDLLISKHHIFTNELGENGKPVNLNFNFADMRTSQFLINGRTLNGYIYPYQFLNIIPMDNIYLVETDKNFTSSIFQNANSSITNFIFKNIQTQRPITRIRYIEDAYDLIATDGSFSHNFWKNLNLTLGFRRNTSNGRFTNSQYDAWTLFINSFWIPRKNLNISLLNIYSTFENALNGGINTTNLSLQDEDIIYNERIAPVNEQTSNLSTKRNDLTLSSNFKIDSLKEINLTLYHTLQADNFSSPENPNKRNSHFFGAKLSFDALFWTANINAGLEFQKNHLDISLLSDSLQNYLLKPTQKSLTSISSFLKSELKLGLLAPASFVRIEILSGKFVANYGAGVNLNFDRFRFFAGASHSVRFPTLIEQSITSSSEFEKHRVYEIGGEFGDKNFTFYIKIQNRKISNHLVFNDSSFYRTYTSRTFIEINSNLKIWKLTLALSPSIILNKVTKPYPRYFLYGELFFEGKLTRTLNLTAGVKAKLSDRFYGFKFINHAFIFSENTSELKKFGTIDLFVSGKIKNVAIFLTLANATNTKYMTSAFYPMQDRSLRFGVVWTFFD